jgi:hypothetical protein
MIRNMELTRRDALRVGAGSLLCSLAHATPVFRLATFRVDATPPAGEPLIWSVPLVKVEEPLWAKGIVLEDGTTRYVLCAIDWCEITNGSELTFRRKLAAAAGTDPSRVAIQTVHQHAAPYADSDAHKLLDQAPDPPLHLSNKLLEDLTDRLADAIKKSLAQLQAFDRIGTGEAKVDRVASTRRIHGPDGKIIVRYSDGGADPELAAAPEGFIDPLLKTITLASGNKPLVRLHYYATHPQTFCCDGRASSDFVGIARETLERNEKVFQIYFTGCAGNVTAGKYNDGTPAAREGLSQRLLAGMEASIASTRFAPARQLKWRTVPLVLPLRADPGYTVADFRRRLEDPKGNPGSRVYLGAMALAFAERIQRPLELSSLEIGKVHILHLPGEPLLEFQMYAQHLKPQHFVAVAGYGDCGPGYICPDRAYDEGGYEPTDTNVGRGSEALLKKAIRQLLGE